MPIPATGLRKTYARPARFATEGIWAMARLPPAMGQRIDTSPELGIDMESVSRRSGSLLLSVLLSVHHSVHRAPDQISMARSGTAPIFHGAPDGPAHFPIVSLGKPCGFSAPSRRLRGPLAQGHRPRHTRTGEFRPSGQGHGSQCRPPRDRCRPRHARQRGLGHRCHHRSHGGAGSGRAAKRGARRRRLLAGL